MRLKSSYSGHEVWVWILYVGKNYVGGKLEWLKIVISKLGVLFLKELKELRMSIISPHFPISYLPTTQPSSPGPAVSSLFCAVAVAIESTTQLVLPVPCLRLLPYLPSILLPFLILLIQILRSPFLISLVPCRSDKGTRHLTKTLEENWAPQNGQFSRNKIGNLHEIA